MADNNTSAADADADNLRANSEAFFYKLDNMEFKVKNATRALLQDNEKYILCLETPETSLMFVLLANTLRKLKEDFPNQYSDLVFTDFHNFIKINEKFPDILVCEMGTDIDEQLDEYSDVLTSWARLVKDKSKKIIFVMKNSRHLERNIMKTKLVNVLKLKFTELWEEHETVHEDCDEKGKDDQASLNKQINDEVSKAKEESIKNLPPQHDDSQLLKSRDILPNNDVDAECNNTPLHIAARNGQNKIVKALLEYDIPKDLRNENGLTPLHLATLGRHYTVVSTLLKNNANVNATDNVVGETALLKACNINDVRLITLLLKFGAEIETKCKYGNTPLHFASSHGHNAAVTTLLKKGSNINAQNNYGQSPLHFAVKNNKEDVVLELLRNGANVHLLDNNQNSALDYAESYKRHNLVQIMAKHVASVQLMAKHVASAKQKKQ